MNYFMVFCVLYHMGQNSTFNNDAIYDNIEM